MNEKVKKLVDAVKAHAQQNYEKDGWDYVVESYTDAEIAEEVKNCRTEAGAIRKIGGIVKMRADYRDDVRNA